MTLGRILWWLFWIAVLLMFISNPVAAADLVKGVGHVVAAFARSLGVFFQQFSKS
jgi:hypothetical protein